MPEIELDTICVNEATICFENGVPLSSIDIVQILISIGIINVHIVDIPILFLLCLKDIDTLGIYLNNITNQLICQNDKNILIFCKWRQP